jgi:8-hydroxy-5-deazaflavin:NADPH oxidoreductase
VPYPTAAPIVAGYGDALVGKVVVDITSPVDFTTFAGLVTPADSSGAQEIAKSAPAGAHVVKAFNTIFASTLADGQVKGEPLDVLIAGDDTDAKARLADLVTRAGLRPLDAGPLERAHWLEGLGFLHMTLASAAGNFGTTVKIVG